MTCGHRSCDEFSFERKWKLSRSTLSCIQLKKLLPLKKSNPFHGPSGGLAPYIAGVVSSIRQLLLEMTRQTRCLSGMSKNIFNMVISSWRYVVFLMISKQITFTCSYYLLISAEYYQIKTHFSVSLDFRTVKRNGILLTLGESYPALTLELYDGNVRKGIKTRVKFSIFTM